MPYPVALAWQEHLVSQPGRAQEDVLLLLEHPPVYTLGQAARWDFVSFCPGQSPWPIYRVRRGGEVTYHGPGQLVGYPILNLTFHRQDLHWYLRQLEAVLIRVLQAYGLAAQRQPGLTGVWLYGAKVAALGIQVKHWVTMHGFALNVCPDLAGFASIVPCGIADQPVGSLNQFLPRLTLPEVIPLVAESFAAVFGLKLVLADPADLPQGGWQNLVEPETEFKDRQRDLSSPQPP